jgi:hypothetical protein
MENAARLLHRRLQVFQARSEFDQAFLSVEDQRIGAMVLRSGLPTQVAAVLPITDRVDLKLRSGLNCANAATAAIRLNSVVGRWKTAAPEFCAG